MDNKIIEYRNKHPRCRYCKYFKRRITPVLSDYCECVLKDKLVKEEYLLDIRGIFCKWFEVGDVR